VGAGAPILEGYGFGSIGTSYSGKLVMTPPASSESSSPRRLVFLDLEGQEAPFSGDMKYFETVRFSPDGTSVVASVAGDGDFFTTDIDLWVYDVTGSTRRQLTFEYRNENHVWMPDGLHLAFESDRAGGQTSDIFLQRADGSSPAEPFIMTVLTDRVPCVYPMTNRR
jgi:Tol biopolymer transport system component